jgi:hypothetical protein
MKGANILKRIALAPIVLIEKYLNFMFEGHILLRMAVNLLIAALCWVIFVLLHHIF